MPLIRRIAKITKLILFLFFLIYLFARLTTAPRICPREEHLFLGEKYKIERCSGGGSDYYYFVQLRIYSTTNQLLGQRNFVIDNNIKNTNFEYTNDKIIYQDAIYDDSGGTPSPNAWSFSSSKKHNQTDALPSTQK